MWFHAAIMIGSSGLNGLTVIGETTIHGLCEAFGKRARERWLIAIDRSMSRLHVGRASVAEFRVERRNGYRQDGAVGLLRLLESEEGVMLDGDLPQSLRCFVVRAAEADRCLIFLKLYKSYFFILYSFMMILDVLLFIHTSPGLNFK